MQISKIEIYKYSIPMLPFTIATGTMHFAQNLFIRIHTDQGITGVGECSAFPMIAGETQATCYEMAKDFAVLWKEKDPLEIEKRMQELDLFTAGNYTVKSAFDMALFDIAAQNAQMPLYRFLGGQNKKIETDLTIGIDSPESMTATAIEYLKKGVQIIKVKLGKNVSDDIQRIQKIRAAIGNQIKIRIDANQGWSFDDAVIALTSLAKYQIEFCEQPMRKWNDALLPALMAISPIPIMADESVFTHHDAKRLIVQNACTYINIKFAKSGGILEATKINEVATEHGIKCMLGGMLESRIAITANMHFALANPNIQFYDLDTCLIGHQVDPVIGGVVYKGMELSISDTPGIGADVDNAFLKSLEQTII